MLISDSFFHGVGHQLANEAGILHRDVSVNNIMIVDYSEDSKFTGFLHDFDHSSMPAEPPKSGTSGCPSSSSSEDEV